MSYQCYVCDNKFDENCLIAGCIAEKDNRYICYTCTFKQLGYSCISCEKKMPYSEVDTPECNFCDLCLCEDCQKSQNICFVTCDSCGSIWCEKLRKVCKSKRTDGCCDECGC